jgi:hypothetical protein
LVLAASAYLTGAPYLRKKSCGQQTDMLSRVLRNSPSLARRRAQQPAHSFSTLRTVGARPGARLPLSATRLSIAAAAGPNSFVRSMSVHHGESTVRPEADKVLQDIADYVHNYKIDSPLAFETARLCLIDTIGCGLEALRFPECTKVLGPVVEGTVVPNGMCFRGLDVPPDLTSYRYPRPWYQLPARPHPRRVQYRNHHPLARFQRLLARCRVSVASRLTTSYPMILTRLRRGTSFRQLGCHPRGC